MTRLARVQAKAKDVAALFPAYEARGTLPFGVDQHQLKLRPPASAAAVKALEAEHKIRLPEEFRAFVLEVGDGGAGPGCGLLPLSYWNFKAILDEPETASPPLSYLASPSPIDPGLLYRPNWPDNEFVDSVVTWDVFQGTIAICYHGCADSDQLIVTGDARGRMVETSEQEIVPLFLPYPDFLTWYESWQDAVLAFEIDAWGARTNRERIEIIRQTWSRSAWDAG